MNISRTITRSAGTQNPAVQRFPKNNWYIAAAAAEVTDAILKRKINGEAMILYRRQDGSAAALRDACPHKGFPLSKGIIVGDDVRCGYHGIQFNGSGVCTNIPSQSAIPSAMNVRAYPVIERGLFVWVWTGDPAQAEDTPLPVLGFEDIPAIQKEFFFAIDVPCNAQLLIDNLFDHTHFTYLHQGTLDNDPDEEDAGGEFMRAPLQFEQQGDAVSTWRNIDSIVATEAVAVIWGVPQGVAFSRRLETKGFPASGYMGSWDCFRDIADPENVVAESAALGGVTPVDEGNCLHFVTWSTTYPQHPQMKEFVEKIVDQDVAVLPDIQRLFVEDDDAHEVSLVADKAAMIARRIVAQAVAREA